MQRKSWKVNITSDKKISTVKNILVRVIPHLVASTQVCTKASLTNGFENRFRLFQFSVEVIIDRLLHRRWTAFITLW